MRDVAVCVDDRGALGEWLHRHVEVLAVLLLTESNLARQLRLVDGLMEYFPRRTRLMDESEITDDRVWERLFRRQFSCRIGPQIEQDLPVNTPAVVRAILWAAPQASSVKELATALVRDRRSLWAELTQARQRSPEELLVLFRFLYSVQASGAVAAREHRAVPRSCQCAELQPRADPRSRGEHR